MRISHRISVRCKRGKGAKSRWIQWWRGEITWLENQMQKKQSHKGDTATWPISREWYAQSGNEQTRGNGWSPLWHWRYQNMHAPGLILTWVDPGMSVCVIADLSFNIKNEILPHSTHHFRHLLTLRANCAVCQGSDSNRAGNQNKNKNQKIPSKPS